uniref:Uncharacterized protein n=1 Tax=Cyanothece sp. (strain PCC 7425 / ATCC 29141) TaxID=395961 RepID=B8HZ85_CYAP4
MTTEVLHAKKNLVTPVALTAMASVLASLLMMTSTVQPSPTNSIPEVIPSADRAFMLT